MNRKRRAKLQNLYDEVPKIKCKGLCAPVACTEFAFSVDEVKNLHKATGEITKQKDGLCNHLENGRCKAYEDRPIVCRIWGVTESLRCPHGCEAEKVLSDAEARRLIYDVFKLSNGLWTDNR